MKIGFAGPQSSGKSTTLKLLKSKYGVDDFIVCIDEITRTMGRDGYKINEDGDNRTQIALMNAHVALLESPPDMIIDRTVMDVLSYTHYLNKNGKVDEKTLNYAKNIYNNYISKYDIIFYFVPEVPIEHDGERSTSISFRDGVEEEFNKLKLNANNVIELRGDIEARAKAIIDWVNQRKEKLKWTS